MTVFGVPWRILENGDENDGEGLLFPLCLLRVSYEPPMIYLRACRLNFMNVVFSISMRDVCHFLLLSFGV